MCFGKTLKLQTTRLASQAILNDFENEIYFHLFDFLKRHGAIVKSLHRLQFTDRLT